jgi:hypothetical protein
MARLTSILLAGLLAGCATSGSFEGQVYRGPEVSYEVGSLQAGWRRVEVARENDAAWSHGKLASVVQVNASCNPELDIPHEALTGHLMIGFTEREYESQQRVPLAAREALRTHVRAKLDGVPRELLLYVLKKNGCVYDFVLVGPPDERFDRARDDFERLVQGFGTRPAEGARGSEPSSGPDDLRTRSER